MYTIILSILIVVLINLIYELFKLSNERDFIFATIQGGVIGLTLGLAIYTIPPLFLVEKYTTITSEDFVLQALGDNQQLRGSLSGGIFVVRGVFEGTAGYTYYQKVNGGYELKNVPAQHAVVYEDEEVEPYVRQRNCVQQMPEQYKHWFWKVKVGCDTKEQFSFHIPQGSITNSINLDL